MNKKNTFNLNNEKSLLGELDLFLFNEGSHTRIHEKLGSHLASFKGERGTYFAVWAPNARKVGVIGDFNQWVKPGFQLKPKAKSGIWEGFIPKIDQGMRYKYFITSKYKNYTVEKADPLALHSENPPATASVVWNIEYTWNDQQWMQKREGCNSLSAPISIYEMHLGSWRRKPEESNRPMSYRELAPLLIEYIKQTGFTHVEFLPVMEHPFYGSWGYQTTGYFAATSRYGNPEDLMYLIDSLHQNDISVILDWVPSHFPNDEHGLGFFDGTHLYEHSDPRAGIHPDWNSFIFNYGRNEVRSFLLSSAQFWLEKFHVDGLRVDAVASMLYLDYSRKEGEWIPNKFGGRENLEAIDFLRRFNEGIYKDYQGTQTIAEESTAWPMVSRPLYLGGLGFGYKWDMGWMHDTLRYMNLDPIYRKYHHNDLTFRMMYAYSENFILPLSHDEVVHGKGALLSKMPGDNWQKFANLRLLLGHMYTQPGKKLLFMGGEFGQWNEWSHDKSLDWNLLNYSAHAGIKRWVEDLNHIYRNNPALYENDFDQRGFQWISFTDIDHSIISFLRRGNSETDILLTVCNFTPVPQNNYRVGVPKPGFWTEILNSDAKDYGGSGVGNLGGVEAGPVSFHGQPFSLNIQLPPLAIVVFKSEL